MPWLMANLGESFSPDVHFVFVETNLNTRLAVLVHKDDTISQFKENLRKEHNQCFPEVGEIKMTAFKVERRNYLYHISDSMIVSKVFEGIRSDCFAYVDVVRVEKGELLSIKAADKKHSKKKISNDTNDLSIEDGLETGVAEKTTKKKTTDRKKSRKKDSVNLNEPAVNSESCAVLSPRENLGDDVLIGAISKDNESAVKNGISVQEIQKVSDEETMEQDLGKGDKAAELVKIDQDKDLAPTLKPADGHVTSTDAVNESVEVPGELQVDVAAENCVILAGEKLDEQLSGPIEKDNEGGEGGKLAPSSGAYLQSAELGASSGLATGPAPEMKKRRRRSSNHSKSSKSCKTKEKMTASQSQPDISNNESPALDGEPNSQAN